MGCQRNIINLHPQQNIFPNPVQDLSNTTPSQTSPQSPLPHVVSGAFGPPSDQYWCQTSSLDCNTDDDNMSFLFPDYKTLCDETLNFNLSSVSVSSVSSDDSVTKDIDDAVNASQPNSSSEFYEPADDISSRSNRPGSVPGQPVQPVQTVRSDSSTINFGRAAEPGETDSEAIAQMKEMIYRAAMFRPVSFDEEEVVERPRRRNVRISSEPQTVAARRRRERVSERIRVLQKLVPGGNKMDTASMLDEAANYMRFLRSQVKAFEQFGYGTSRNADGTSGNAGNVNRDVALGVPLPMQSHFLQAHEKGYTSSKHQ